MNTAIYFGWRGKICPTSNTIMPQSVNINSAGNKIIIIIIIQKKKEREGKKHLHSVLNTVSVQQDSMQIWKTDLL